MDFERDEGKTEDEAEIMIDEVIDGAHGVKMAAQA